MNVAERVGRAPADALMVVHCLGKLRLEDVSGREVRLRTRKARAVLAALALHGKPLSRDALADLLWSDRGTTQARASLRQTIFELQHVEWRGDSVVAASREDVAVARQAIVTDLQLIRSAAENGDWARLLALIEMSDAGLLTDLDGLDAEFDDWLRQQRAHEPARTIGTAVAAAERCADEVGPRPALDLVAGILRLDPVNEEATRLAMRLSSEIGDRVAMHRYFVTLRDRLRDDLGAEPSAETVELFERLGNGRADTAARPAAAVAETKTRSPDPKRVKVPLALAVVMAALLLVVASIALLWRSGSPARAARNGVVVAVLPFEQEPPDGSFLATGLWEQTRGALTRNRSIKVLGRTTTEAMVGQKLAPDGYRRRFGVTHLLEGSVHRSGNELLVSVSLTQTSDGVSVWQNTFRGRIGQPFALQDAIADGIEGQLRAQLAPGGGRKAEQIATSPEVYALYSEARQLIALRTHPAMVRAEALLRDAVRRDPNYAPAWSLLGAAIFFNGFGAITNAQSRVEGTRAVQHALSLAPDFAPAHATLAMIQGEQSRDAEASLRRAVALDPNYSEAWNWLANSLSAQGKKREAIAAYRRSIEIDPLFAPAVLNLFNAASDLDDTAVIEWLMQSITKAGASQELVDSLNVARAYRRGDLSGSINLLSARGLEPDGRPKAMLWDGWFEALTAMGLYGDLHHITGCPEWYAPLLSGEALPPTSYQGKTVTPEQFWTSQFFSAPAARAMVRRGRSGELVRMYRSGYRGADDFVAQIDRRNMLPELAANLAIALRNTGSSAEADEILRSASARLEQGMKSTPDRDSIARLALIRGAQRDRVEAVSLLEQAVRKGWFPNGREFAVDLADEPSFARAVGDPRFQAVRKRLLNHVAEERAKLGPLKV